MTRLLNLEHREKRLLGNLDRADLLHALFPFALLLEQLALAGDVAAVALGRHILAQRPDRLARDHLRPDRRLDHDLEQLARNQVLQLLGDLASPFIRLVLVNDHAEGVHGLAVEQHVQLHELARAICQKLIVERRVAAGNRLQLVVEVEDDFREREFPVELDAGGIEILHPAIDAAALLPELHDAPDVVDRDEDASFDVRLLDAVHLRTMRQPARIFDQLHGAVGAVDVIFDVRNRADEIEVELALEPFAHDFHGQQAEEAAAKTEAQGNRGLRLVVEGRVVQLQLRQRVAELLILLGVGRIESGEDHRLDIAIARQQGDVPVLGIEHGIARSDLPHAADVSHEVADFACLELLRRLVAELEVADFVDLIDVVPVGAEGDLHSWLDDAIDDTDRGNRAAITVVIGVEDQRAQRGLVIAARGRDAVPDRLERLGDAAAFFRRYPENLLRFRANEVMDLVGPLVGLGTGKIDLIQDGYDLESRVHREQ